MTSTISSPWSLTLPISPSKRLAYRTRTSRWIPPFGPGFLWLHRLCSAHLWRSHLALELLRRSKRSGPHKRRIPWNRWTQRERRCLILRHVIRWGLYCCRESLDEGGFEERHLHLRRDSGLGSLKRASGVRLEVVSDSLNDGLRISFLGIESSFGGISNDFEDSK